MIIQSLTLFKPFYNLIRNTYDFIYMNALLENEDLAKKVIEFEGFTDIEFNPNKSIGCQAKAAAMFVGLYRAGRIDDIKNPESFIKLYR